MIKFSKALAEKFAPFSFRLAKKLQQELINHSPIIFFFFWGVKLLSMMMIDVNDMMIDLIMIQSAIQQ